MNSSGARAAALATRLAFFVAGFGFSAWAPLVPLAKARLGVDDGLLGLLLLCLGLGSVPAMASAGYVSARFGCKAVILGGCIGLSFILPLLAVAATPAMLAISLLMFGASLGSLDVAMNIHAVEVERAAGRPLMSGFHGLFSLGGVMGAACMSVLLSTCGSALVAGMLCAGAMLIATFMAWSRLLPRVAAASGPHSAIPRGIVVVLVILAGVSFLVEGAMLDWGGVLITGRGLVPVAQGGWGYGVFSLAMTAGRLTGDAVVARLGERRVIAWGGTLAVAGLILLILAPVAWAAMLGFLMVGLGASNIVPILFRKAGNQSAMPAGLAVAAITTVGYAGVLLGPAAVGFVSKAFSLPTAFGLLAALFCLVPSSARSITEKTGESVTQA